MRGLVHVSMLVHSFSDGLLQTISYVRFFSVLCFGPSPRTLPLGAGKETDEMLSSPPKKKERNSLLHRKRPVCQDPTPSSLAAGCGKSQVLGPSRQLHVSVQRVQPIRDCHNSTVLDNKTAGGGDGGGGGVGGAVGGGGGGEEDEEQEQEEQEHEQQQKHDEKHDEKHEDEEEEEESGTAKLTSETQSQQATCVLDASRPTPSGSQTCFALA
eukprot:3829333-Rhodomonas_salina.1